MTHVGKLENNVNSSPEILKVRDAAGQTDVDERVILKRIFKKY